MVQLIKKELENLSIDLNTFSALADKIDEKLSLTINEMQPKIANDNFGTQNMMTATQSGSVAEDMECLHKISEYAQGLKSAIDNVIKTL